MKKIMFSTEYGLQQGVIARTKTMTRRVDKKLNHPLVTDISEWGIDDNGKCYLTITYSTGLTEDVYPAYQIGEEVAVAQAYQTLWWPALPGIDWKAITDEVTHSKGWTNKMFVKAEYMPYRIRITNIRVERLQDISDEDCLREGIYDVFPYIDRNPNDKVKSYWFVDKKSKYGYHQLSPVRDCFALLIDKVSGKGTWERNPWVFVYEFELVKQQRVRIELKQTEYGTDNKE